MMKKYEVLFTSGYQHTIEIADDANPIGYIVAYKSGNKSTGSWLIPEDQSFAINLDFVEGIIAIKES